MDRYFGLLFLMMLAVACAPAVQPTAPVEQGISAPTDVIPTQAATSSSYAGPAWANFTLTDARTGAAFALADFAGKTLYVETMATWCPPCRTQLINVNQAMGQVSADQHVFVVLSVAENISNEDLARYANDNGFNMRFAIATSELLDALVNAFGFSVSSPPSTPHFTISPAGTVSSLHTGISGPESLVAELAAVSAA